MKTSKKEQNEKHEERGKNTKNADNRQPEGDQDRSEAVNGDRIVRAITP
jgi:hypothetical protein